MDKLIIKQPVGTRELVPTGTISKLYEKVKEVESRRGDIEIEGWIKETGGYDRIGNNARGLSQLANISDDYKDMLVSRGCTATGSTDNWTIKAPGEA